jgi:hypothetical protein
MTRRTHIRIERIEKELQNLRADLANWKAHNHLEYKLLLLANDLGVTFDYVGPASEHWTLSKKPRPT